MAKRVVKAEFEIDIWLISNSNKQMSMLHYVETRCIGLEKL